MGSQHTQMERSRLENSIAILGVGIMGSSIACAIALSDIHVMLWNRRTPERAIKRIARILDRAIEKEEISKARKEEILSLIRVTTELREIADSGFIIESIVEDLQAKKQLLSSVDQICSTDAVLATNTSSLSITELASATRRPERIIGMHFFNPAHRMELVELILTRFTSERIYERAKTLVQQIGKTAVAIEDSVGSIVNRVLLVGINEAVAMLAQLPTKPEEIDRAVCLGANHVMGPLALADFIGLDICVSILDNFHRRFEAERFRPHPLLMEKVHKGLLGRKTGQGFFCYDER